MATWQDRLQSSIILTSPQTGTVFSPLWRNDSSSAKKKLGIFEYPLSIGSVIQDLGLTSFEIPITLYFEGTSNDLDAQAFLIACAEYGLWNVVHPVRGTLNLQLAEVSDHVDPTDSGNITLIETKWLNPSALKLQVSNSELAGQISSSIAATNSQASSQFSNISSSLDAIAAAYGSITQSINAIKQNLTNITSAFYAAYTQLQTAIAGFSTDLLSVSGLVQGSIQSPGIMSGDLTQQMGSLALAGSTALGIVPSAATVPGIVNRDTVAQSAGAELALVAITGALAQTVITIPPTTRTEAINAINSLLAWWSTLQNALDGSMILFQNSNLAASYISLASSYPQLEQLMSLTIQYLLSIIFDLKTQITFTLPAERPPLAIAIDFYGQNGWDDSSFDLFIKSNKLYGDQINLLPQGFQVTIYLAVNHG